MCRSVATDAARIIELGRANEVCCLFVWNTSGLDNYRPAEERTFAWPDPNTPYAKPLAHLPYESEYAWWRDEYDPQGEIYRPGPSFEQIKRAQRPLAIVVWEERTQFYKDRPVPHKVFLVNDLPSTVSGRMHVRLEQDGRTWWQDQRPVTVPSGRSASESWRVPLDVLPEPGPATIVTTFSGAQGMDEVHRELSVEDAGRRTEPLDLPAVAVWGDSRIVDWFDAHGIESIAVDQDSELDATRLPLLVLGEHVVEPGSPMNQTLHEYVTQGGRLLVLEQNHSLFPGVQVARMPAEMARVRDRAHPVLAGITDPDLRFFGDDPFGVPSSDSWVTVYPYVKPRDEHLVRPLVDSSGGDFGTGGLT